MRGRLGAYAVWQLRDYVLERGLPSLVVGALLLTVAVGNVRGMRQASRARDIPIAAVVTDMLVGLTGLFAFVLVVLGVNGIVSNDRKMGYFRFLFAKPVSVPRYYAQAFAINGVGVVAAMTVFLGAFSALAYPLFPAGALAYAALYYVLLGGIGFLLSAVTRHDWVSMAGVWAATFALRGIVPRESGWVGEALYWVLPPTHRITAAGEALVSGAALPAGSVAWVLAYGGGALLLGLLILRRRALAP